MQRKRTLDRTGVVRTAAMLADEVGLEQLTLAQLAEQLGVRIPSLYNHVAGLAGLRRELALHGMRELVDRLRRVAVGKTAGEAIAAVADTYRAFAHEHPGLYAASLRAPDPADPELRAAGAELVELVLALLAAYHLDDESALHAVRGLRSVIHGFVALEAAGAFALALDRDESYRRLVRVFIDGLQICANA